MSDLKINPMAGSIQVAVLDGGYHFRFRDSEEWKPLYGFLEDAQNNLNKIDKLNDSLVLTSKQRDQLERESNAWRELAESRLEEVNALEAHIEIINNQISYLLNIKGIENFDEVNGTKIIRRLRQVKDTSPKNTLSERDKNVAGKSYADGCKFVVNELFKMARSLVLPHHFTRRATFEAADDYAQKNYGVKDC